MSLLDGCYHYGLSQWLFKVKITYSQNHFTCTKINAHNYEISWAVTVIIPQNSSIYSKYNLKKCLVQNVTDASNFFNLFFFKIKISALYRPRVKLLWILNRDKFLETLAKILTLLEYFGVSVVSSMNILLYIIFSIF